MSEFTKELPFGIMINALKKSINSSCIELQLVWLVEVLLLIAFRDNMDKQPLPKPIKPIKAKPGYYNLTLYDMKLLFLNVFHPKVIQSLIEFRCDFVHLGYMKAQYKFDAVANVSDDIDVIAKKLGLSLNWDNKIFY